MSKGKSLYELASPLLFKLDPEKAHKASLAALNIGLAPSCKTKDDPRLHQNIGPLTFTNPLGLAAGYDKNGDAIAPLQSLGFGFVELGSVTPLAQDGNPKPRLFRLQKDEAIINRMGFNNDGLAAMAKKLATPRKTNVPIGANIGANKSSTDRINDYCLGLKALWDGADYFTANISSPNTPNLRDLQGPEQIKSLLTAMLKTKQNLEDATGQTRPLFIKLAPDIHPEDRRPIWDEIMTAKLDGIIISNTTISRHQLNDPQAKETGGLSGVPLFEPSTQMLGEAYCHIRHDMKLIGVGGINSFETALQKIEAGASLIQLYSGLVYKGPGLIKAITDGLSNHLETHKISHVKELIGRKADQWAQPRNHS